MRDPNSSRPLASAIQAPPGATMGAMTEETSATERAGAADAVALRARDRGGTAEPGLARAAEQWTAES